MAEIVNLRQVRKARKREADASQAAANRARHGQSKADRARAHDEAARRDALLDGVRRENPED